MSTTSTSFRSTRSSRPSNTLVNVFGGYYNDIHGNPTFNARYEDDGLRILYPHISPLMLHDNRHRLYNFKCHPEMLRTATRVIKDWYTTNRGRGAGSIFHLHGASRTERTAIVQAMADHYSQSTPSPLLAATFITEEHARHQIITTIAYQLALAIPQTRPHIFHALREDPAIVDRHLGRQCESLILGPLRHACGEATALERQSWPNLIVLDGVDDWIRGMDPDLQSILCEVLEFDAFPTSILLTTRLRSEADLGGLRRSRGGDLGMGLLRLDSLCLDDSQDCFAGDGEAERGSTAFFFGSKS